MLRQTFPLACIVSLFIGNIIGCSDDPKKPTTSGTGGAAGSSAESSSSSSSSSNASSTSSGMNTGGTGGMGTGGMGTGGMAVEPPPPCNIGMEQRLTVYSNNNQEPISMVWNGNEYASFYRDYINSKMGIYFSRWSKSGIQQGAPQMIVESPMPITDGDFFAKTWWNGSGYAVLWSHQGSQGWSMYFSSYDAQANMVVAPVKIATNSVYGHSLAYSGSEYGLAWVAGSKAYFVIVSANGNIMGSPTELGPATLGNSGPEIAVAWSGNEYGVAWTNNSEVLFTRVNGAGAEVITEITVGPSQYDGGPDLVWGQGEYVMAWAADGATPAEGSRVFAQRIAENGMLKGNRIEVKNLGNMSSPIRILPTVDIHFNGTNYALAWASNELVANGFELYVARFDATMQKKGTDIQATALGVRNAGTLLEAGNYPRLVWNGDEYLVTWHDYLGSPAAWNAYMRSVCY